MSDVQGGIVQTNPTSTQKVILFIEKNSLWAVIITFAIGLIAAYTNFVWKVNEIMVKSAERDIELQGQISELKGKLDFLVNEKKK